MLQNVIKKRKEFNWPHPVLRQRRNHVFKRDAW
jgi:hypothetical protein